MKKLFVLGVLAISLYSCSSVFDHCLKINVDNKTSTAKTIKLHTVDSIENKQDSITITLNPNESETFKWKDAQLTGDGYVSLTIDEALHDKPLMGYVTNGYVDGEASLTIFSVDSILIE
jgi:hypothetical protein